MSVPLFIVCQRPGCDQLRQVRRPFQQRRGGYCSSRCAALVTRNLTRAAQVQGGRISTARRRARLVARVRGLSPLAAFRLGYTRGWQAQWRRRRRRPDAAVTRA